MPSVIRTNQEVSAMSKSVLYHAFGIKGVIYQSAYFLGNTVFFRVEATDRHIRSPACGHRYSTFKGQKVRRLRMPPIGRKQAVLELTMHRLQCGQCENLWWPRLPFMKGTARYTRSFALTVLDPLRFGTIGSVAEYFRVGWDTVKNIHKEKLTSVYRKIDLKKVEHLGTDEFSIRKGRTYMTVFIDLQTGGVLHAVEGTGPEDIAPFLKTPAKNTHNIKAVSMDMSGGFISSFKKRLPDVPVVFDRYHITAQMSRAIDSLRRERFNLLDTAGQKPLKGSRFLLLRNFRSLTEKNRRRLEKLLEVNRPLFIMHTMKEQLRLFRRQRSGKAAAAFLKQRCFDALMSDIKRLTSIGAMILRHWNGLLNYYPHRISNGPLEELNNKTKTIKRQAYGFRDMQYFKLRLYDMHTSKYLFAG